MCRKGNEKAPLGLYRLALLSLLIHAPRRLTSRTPWNKQSVFLFYFHYKSEILRSVVLFVLDMTDNQIVEYLNSNNYDIRVSHNARWIDQKSPFLFLFVLLGCSPSRTAHPLLFV